MKKRFLFRFPECDLNINWLWLLIISTSIVKIWFVKGLQITAYYDAVHDDLHFVQQALYLLQGKWLGPYNQLSLIKGPSYPFFLALTSIFEIPLIISQNLVYILSCILFVVALFPLKIKRWVSYFLFLVLLFNPLTFDKYITTRVYRDYLYASITILIVSLCIGLLLRIHENDKKIIFWSIGLGIALFGFWTMREEGVWILPYVILLPAYAMFDIVKKQRDGFFKKISFLGLPFLLFGLGLITVSGLNYYKYGVFGITEMTNRTFTSAFGSLTRIKSDSWYEQVPVPSESRNILYQFSPAMRELKTYFEGDVGESWSTYNPKGVVTTRPEIFGGWSVWAFRDAVSYAGYYSNGKFPKDFYNRLISETNKACQSDEIDCYPLHHSLLQPIDKRHYGPILNSIKQASEYIINLSGINVTDVPSNKGSSNQLLFQSITNQQEESDADREVNNSVKIQLNWIKTITIPKVIYSIYKTLLPIATLLSFLLSPLFLINLFFSKDYKKSIILISIIGMWIVLITRITLLALIDATSFPAINTSYLSPLYALLISINCFSLAMIIRILKKLKFTSIRNFFFKR